MTSELERHHYQAVFFDFDGVILDSVNVKTNAFATMFRPYGKDVERAAVDYHLTNGGLSRYNKFEYIYRNVLKQSVSVDQLERLGKEFSQLTLEGVIKAPFIPGALETLKNLKSLGVPCFVVSGTPEEEIRFIVRERNLEVFFLEVHGSPGKKEIIVKDIIKKYNFDSGKCLFVGDAMSDYEAARKTGLNFLGIVKENEDFAFPKEVDVKCKVDFSELIQEKPDRFFSFNGQNYVETTYHIHEKPIIISYEITLNTQKEYIPFDYKKSVDDGNPPMPLLAYPLAVYQIHNKYYFQFKTKKDSGEEVEQYIDYSMKPGQWCKFKAVFDLKYKTINISFNDMPYQRVSNADIDLCKTGLVILGKGYLNRFWKGAINSFQIYGRRDGSNIDYLNIDPNHKIDFKNSNRNALSKPNKSKKDEQYTMEQYRTVEAFLENFVPGNMSSEHYTHDVTTLRSGYNQAFYVNLHSIKFKKGKMRNLCVVEKCMPKDSREILIYKKINDANPFSEADYLRTPEVKKIAEEETHTKLYLSYVNGDKLQLKEDNAYSCGQALAEIPVFMNPEIPMNKAPFNIKRFVDMSFDLLNIEAVFKHEDSSMLNSNLIVLGNLLASKSEIEKIKYSIQNVFCHNDIKADNVIVNNPDGRISYNIIDWAAASYDCVGTDLGGLLFTKKYRKDEKSNTYKILERLAVDGYRNKLLDFNVNCSIDEIYFAYHYHFIIRFLKWSIKSSNFDLLQRVTFRAKKLLDMV